MPVGQRFRLIALRLLGIFRIVAKIVTAKQRVIHGVRESAVLVEEVAAARYA
jgi:hypothetical protein